MLQPDVHSPAVLVVETRDGRRPLPFPTSLLGDGHRTVRRVSEAIQEVASGRVDVVVLLGPGDDPFGVGVLRQVTLSGGVPLVHLAEPVRSGPDGCEMAEHTSGCSRDTVASERLVMNALASVDPSRPVMDAQASLDRLQNMLDGIRSQLQGVQVASRAPSVPASASSLPIERLSDREIEVFEELKTGASNKEIAGRLFVSVHTVGNHLRSIYKKLDVHSRGELLAQLH